MLVRFSLPAAFRLERPRFSLATPSHPPPSPHPSIPMNASSSSKDHSSPLIDSLVSGFETLLTTVRAHIDNEKVLRERLDFAANEVSRMP